MKKEEGKQRIEGKTSREKEPKGQEGEGKEKTEGGRNGGRKDQRRKDGDMKKSKNSHEGWGERQDRGGLRY